MNSKHVKSVKRYPNRKLYDLDESRYITLDEIAVFLREGGEVTVMDSKTGEDITAVTLAQVLLGEEKKNRPAASIQRLMVMLQTGTDFIHKKFAPVSTLADEAEKTVHRLMAREPGEELKEFIVSTQHAYEEVQHRADERLQMVVATVRNFAPMAKEIRKLRKDVAEIKKRIVALEEASPKDK